MRIEDLIVMSNLTDKIDKFFRITERNSTIQQEIRGGIITFLAMAYILIVNPNILSSAAAGYSWEALFTATALAAIIASILMGVYSRFPVALAPGMGVNAFLAYTICLGMGFSFPQGLMVVFISGILFLILTVTGLRVKIIDSIPGSMKLAISAGIGFFIAVVGLYNGGIITHGNGSALTLGNIADPGVLLSIFCVLVTVALWFRGWWGAVIVGMVLTWVVGLIMGAMDVTSVLVLDGIYLIPQWTSDVMSSPDFSLVFALFTDFEMFESSMFVSFIAAIVSLFVVDMFDTAGTLIGVGTEAGMIDKDGHVIDGEKALTCDAVGTIAGALVGTSTTTSFIESTTGIAAGARTGLMSVVVGLMFVVALFFSPFFGTFTSACTVGALVLVGILMIKSVKKIEWDDPVIAGMAFVTIFLMGLCGSITDGIAFGIFFYVLGMAITGRVKEITPMIWGLTVVFLVYFFVNGIVIPNGWI